MRRPGASLMLIGALMCTLAAHCAKLPGDKWHLRGRALMQAGYPCTLKGVVELAADKPPRLRTATGMRWVLQRRGDAQELAAGEALQIKGTCDKSTAPFTLWVSPATEQPQATPTTEAPSGGNDASSSEDVLAIASADASDTDNSASAVIKTSDGWWSFGSTDAPASTPAPTPAPTPTPTPAPKRAPFPPPSPRQVLSGVVARAADAWPAMPPSPPPLDEMSVVVLVVDMCDMKVASSDMSDISDAVANKLPSYFPIASHGALDMPPNSPYTRVARVSIGCSGTASDGSVWKAKGSTCDSKTRNGWADAADTVATTVLGIDVSMYTHRVYVVPTAVGCANYGTVGCSAAFNQALRVWMTGYKTSSLMTLIHELGHNLGMQHSQGYDSSGNLSEYADGSCPMGSASAPVHFNAPQSFALRWLTPQASLTADGLPAGVYVSFKLRGLADSRVSSLQLFAGSWMDGAKGWRYDDQLWVSFRRWTPTGEDAALASQYRNKVQVHKKTSGDVLGMCTPTVLLSTLGSDASWPGSSNTPADTTSPSLTIRVTRIDDVVGAAYVSICRSGMRDGQMQKC